MQLFLIILVSLSNVLLTKQEILQQCSISENKVQTYQWNKEKVSQLHYADGYCFQRCHGDQLVLKEPYQDCWSLECVPCNCARPACHIYNNCCPDVSVQYIRENVEYNTTFTDVNVYPTNDPSQVERREREPVLGCEYSSWTGLAYLYIRSCLPDYTHNQTVVDLCEANRSQQEETVDTFVRVVDWTTHVIYKNKFCAVCNKINNFSALSFNVEFKSPRTIFKSIYNEELLQLFLTRAVKFYYNIPGDLRTFECLLPVGILKSNDYKEVPEVVDTCRTTINSSTFMDKDVIRACGDMAGKSLQVYDRVHRVIYKNIYCAICNMFSYPDQGEECHCLPYFGFQQLPFSMLLDLTKKTQMESLELKSKCTPPTSRCSVFEWLSPEGECLQVICAPGKRVHNSGCIETVQQITGLYYNLHLWLTPVISDFQNMSATIDLSLLSANGVMDAIIIQITLLFEGISEHVSIRLETYKDNSTHGFELSPLYCVECKVIADKSLSRTKFESELLSKVTEGTITVVNADNVSIEFNAYPMFQKWNITGSFEVVAKSFRTNEKQITVDDAEFITVTQTLLCQHVKFDQARYRVTLLDRVLPANITIEIDFNSTTMEIGDYEELSMLGVDQDGGLNVCRDLLDRKLGKMLEQDDWTVKKLTGASMAEYVISIFCCSASIICILLTLLTYFLFPVLRTEAGINNMFLCGSLLLAQVSLLGISHIYQPSIVCTLLGLITHFMWLWMFKWSFICSYHMFKVFTSDTTRQSTSLNRHLGLGKKIVFSFIGPAAIVLSAVLYSYYVSHGTELGYGLTSCYLNSTILVGLTLVGPLSVTTLVNVIFFIITVYKIYKVRQLQSSFSHDDQRKDWFVYVRLSSVTGAFWTVAIVAAALDSIVLKFISIVLNGLQGVAIFVSFTCNKRVVTLFSELRKPKPNSSGTTALVAQRLRNMTSSNNV